MPIRNYFPVFHRLKTGAYSYIWTDKCEVLLPKHYKNRCLEYMLQEPKPVHWVPNEEKYTVDKYGKRIRVQNHPIEVKYPVQCNKGLWGGEGIVQGWARYIKGTSKIALNVTRCAKFYAPVLVNRLLYSEVLDKWFRIPCTNRAMDLIDEAFGLDYYLLQSHERDINSKLGMDLKRKMLLALNEMSEQQASLEEDRQKVYNRYKSFMIPREEAEWVGLSIQEALEKAEAQIAAEPVIPLKLTLQSTLRDKYREYKLQPPIEEEELEELAPPDDVDKQETVTAKDMKGELKSWLGMDAKKDNSAGDKKTEAR